MAKTGSKIPAKDWVGLSFISKARQDWREGRNDIMRDKKGLDFTP
jgi:hypothetical protein